MSRRSGQLLRRCRQLGKKNADGDTEALDKKVELMAKLGKDRWELVVDKIFDYCEEKKEKTLCQNPSSCPVQHLEEGSGLWKSVPEETIHNKERVNEICIRYMELCAHWHKDAFFGPVSQLVLLLDKVSTVNELFGVFPKFAKLDSIHEQLGPLIQLPLHTGLFSEFTDRYILWHDPDVDYSGDHLHLKYGDVNTKAARYARLC